MSTGQVIVERPLETRTDVSALIAGLVTVTLWGSAFVAIRDGGKTLSPGSLALDRLLVSLGLNLISISSSLGTGASTSSTRTTSGGPYVSQTSALTGAVSPNGSQAGYRRQSRSSR